jgi:putative cell wall-binding protein
MLVISPLRGGSSAVVFSLVLVLAVIASWLVAAPAGAAPLGTTPTGSITGRVIAQTADGSMVPSSAGRLTAVSPRTNSEQVPVPSLERRPDGTFTFTGVLPGRWYVTLEAPNPGPYRYGSPRFWVDVPAEGPVASVGDLQLILSQLLSGQVSAVVDGRTVPLPYADVTIWWKNPATGAYKDEGYESAATEDGRWEVPLLRPGTYRLSFGDKASQSPRAHDDLYWPAGRRFVDAEDIVITPGLKITGLDVVLTERTFTTTRVAGDDRFGTGAAVLSSPWGFPATNGSTPRVPVLYVANGLNFPDALSAGPAAAHEGGALAMTDRDALPAATVAVIERLAPERIVVVGGPAAVSDEVYDQLASRQPAITRLGGADRYETSRLVARHSFLGSSTGENIYLATGEAFPDALAAGPAAHRDDAPVVLVRGGLASADAPTKALMVELGKARAVIVGGTASISRAYEASLAEQEPYISTWRRAGADRYETAAALVGGRSETIFVASGRGFADALVAGAVAAHEGASLVLSEEDCVPAATERAVLDARVFEVVLVGGPSVLGAANEVPLAVCGR